MAVVTDATLGLIKNQIHKQNQILKNFADTFARSSWQEVQATVRAGEASRVYDIGDEFICKYTYDGVQYDFPWVVADIDREVELQNGDKKNGLVLQAKYATIEEIPFDAAEQNAVTESTAQEGWYYYGVADGTWTMLDLTTGAAIPTTGYDNIYKATINDANVIRYGYNRWSHSAYRQWLNSDAAAGSWWTAQHTGDVAPAQAATLPGFLKGLDSDFVDVLATTKISTSCNTVTDGGVTDVTYDKIFLPSLEEMYGSPQAQGVEGAYFPYWKEITGLDSPTNGSSSNTNDARKIKKVNDVNGSAVYCRLRSATRSYSYAVWSVTTSGYLGGSGSSTNAFRCVPACVIV